ncbi:hypothetical protein Goari_008487, partial [Gossypium aridum]|nr:hypothetical protein [Gossypium aridum]
MSYVDLLGMDRIDLLWASSRFFVNIPILGNLWQEVVFIQLYSLVPTKDSGRTHVDPPLLL